jgi:predicted phage baseplate assembly protein
VVAVVQGQTNTYTLGSGDGMTPNARFALGNASPVLCAYQYGKSDPEPRLTVLVDRVPWNRVSDFGECLPRDHVRRLDVDADTKATITFGDGTHGAIPPFGTNNITVSVCTGDAEAGNLPAKAINKLLDGILGIKETYNLSEATGGRKGDNTKQVRDALRLRQTGIERVVSAQDAPSIALELGEVLHAQVDPTAEANELRLVVALQQRRTLSDDTRKVLTERLTPLLPAAADLRVVIVGAEQVPVYLSIAIEVAQGHQPATVLARVQQAFAANSSGFFAPERWPIGAHLRLGDVYEALFGIAGVAQAQVTWLSSERPDGAAQQLNDFVSPGVRGVIRCDNDPVSDPHQDYGSIQFTVDGGSP